MLKLLGNPSENADMSNEKGSFTSVLRNVASNMGWVSNKRYHSPRLKLMDLLK